MPTASIELAKIRRGTPACSGGFKHIVSGGDVVLAARRRPGACIPASAARWIAASMPVEGPANGLESTASASATVVGMLPARLLCCLGAVKARKSVFVTQRHG